MGTGQGFERSDLLAVQQAAEAGELEVLQFESNLDGQENLLIRILLTDFSVLSYLQAARSAVSNRSAE